MKKNILIWSLLIGLPVAGFAQTHFNKAGRTSMQFLKIGVGARSTAMGEASSAHLQTVESVFNNPAAIAGIDNFQAGFSYTRWFGDLNVSSGAVGYNIPGFGVVALNYVAMDYGDIREALTTSPTGGVDTRTGRTFSGNDLSLGCAFSRWYTDKLSIGVQVKYIQEDLFTFSSYLWAFDVGSYYETGWKGIRLAMSAQNFTRQARWLYTKEEEQQTFEIPLLFRVGCSIDLWGGPKLFLGGDPMQHRLTLNMDALHTNDYAERLNLGLEYWAFNMFALRAGYRFNYDEGNLSIGTGVNLNIRGTLVQIDYSFVNYDFLESPHRVSAILEF
ncbi:MAG: PorV/PorQ family protein [Calditrichaeota bacterium]|nr:MAG: PorV/PorQ family protein [Calditrichota bacterium]